MDRKQKTRWIALSLGLVLFVFACWFLAGGPSAFRPLEPGPSGLHAASGEGQSTLDGDVKTEAPGEETGEIESAGTDVGEQRKSRRRPDPPIRRRVSPPLEAEQEEDETPSRFNWIVVDEFGVGLVEVPLQLTVEDREETHTWDLETDSKGRLALPETDLSAGAKFISLRPASEDFSMELLVQEPHEPLQQKLVVRLVEKGRLNIHLRLGDGTPSKLSYSALLYPYGQEGSVWKPEYASGRSHDGDVQLKCPPGVYELVLAPEGTVHHTVVDATHARAIPIHVHPGRDTHVQIPEPKWVEEDWTVSPESHAQPFGLQLLGCTEDASTYLDSPTDDSPRWPRAVRPAPNPGPQFLLLRPRETLAFVVSGGRGNSMALLSRQRVLLGFGSQSYRKLNLGPLVGDRVRTTLHSHVLAVLHADQRQVQAWSRLKHPTPDWLEIEAVYANDNAWSRAQASIALHSGSNEFRLANLMEPQILDLSKPPIGRMHAPQKPGLRWSYGDESSEVTRFAVDLLPSKVSIFAVPIPTNAPTSFEGLLSWIPQSSIGLMGIGDWRAHPRYRKYNPSPGFRTFQLKCVQESGEPAPYAMVQARGLQGQTTWRGSADENGKLTIQVLGSGAYWIDSGLLQNPVQIQLHDKLATTKPLVLMVPMHRSQIQVVVTGDAPLHTLKAKLTLWKQPKEFPGRTYPAIAEELLGPDGQLVFQSLVPADYRVEVFDPARPTVVEVRRLRITRHKPFRSAKIHWQPR